MAMRTLTSPEVKVKSYKIHLMEMVINAIYYNPLLSLQTLESNAWTNKFFGMWFSSIDSFTRVHDKKLSISAIVALLTLNADQVPVSVQQGWPRLLQVSCLQQNLSCPLHELTLSKGIVRLFQTLPAAVKSK